MNSVKVGVIGTGHLGRYHALKYAGSQKADLVGVADVDYEKAVKVAEESGCKAYTNSAELLKDVEAVSIAVPTDKHFDLGLEAMSAGVHCLIEKPIASTEEEASKLVNAAEEKGIVFQIGHIERFNPALLSLSGMALKPLFIETHRLAPFTPRGTEVAVVLDLMIHDLDIILHMIDSPVQSVDASGVAVVSDTVDIANARIRFENGCVANLTASRISQKRMRKMRIFQKNTYVAIDFNGRASEVFELKTETDTDIGEQILTEMGVGERKKVVVYKKYDSIEADALETEVNGFLSAVRGESHDGVSGQDGKKALSLALHILSKMEA